MKLGTVIVIVIATVTGSGSHPNLHPYDQIVERSTGKASLLHVLHGPEHGLENEKYGHLMNNCIDEAKYSGGMTFLVEATILVEMARST